MRYRKYDSRHSLHEFSALINEMLSKIDEDKFCFIIYNFLERRCIKEKKLNSMLPKNLFERKRNCTNEDLTELKCTDEDFREPNKYAKIFDLQAHLYNYLPLTVQCGILIEITLRKVSEETDKGEVFKYMKAIHNNTYFNNKTERKNYLKNLGTLIKQTEKEINQGKDLTMKIWRQCKNILLHRKAFSKSIEYFVQYDNQTTEKAVEEILRTETAQIAGDYAETIGKKPKTDGHFPGIGEQVYFGSVQKVNKKVKKGSIFHVAYIPVRNGANPVNIHLIMAALYNYGIEKFKNKFNINMRFSAIRDQNKLEYGTFEFPPYLKRYIDTSNKDRKCMYVELITQYSLHTKFLVITSFRANQRADTDLRYCLEDRVLSSKEKQLRDKYFPEAKNEKAKKHTKLITFTPTSPKPQISVTPKKNVIIRKLTNLEIIMIAALSITFVSSIVFFITCVIFLRRKKKYHHAKLPTDVSETSARAYSDCQNVCDDEPLKTDLNNKECGSLKSISQNITGNNTSFAKTYPQTTNIKNGVLQTEETSLNIDLAQSFHFSECNKESIL